MFSDSLNCTDVRFASFLSGGFTTMAVMNPPEKKLEKRTFMHCTDVIHIKSRLNRPMKPFWVVLQYHDVLH
jgi:hypothetical protein